MTTKPFHFNSPDGFNGSTVLLDGSKILKADWNTVQLRVVGTSLVKWIRKTEYDAALSVHEKA